MIKEVARLKKTEGIGNLYIKEFPTGNANANSFRKYLRELRMRKIKIDILYCDYIGIMNPIAKSTGNMYIDVKKVAEELRALSLEFDLPIVSATQINRDGSKLDLKELDHNYVAESSGVAATADFLMFLGDNEDLFTYENEIHYKIIKNRIGGRVGDINKFYIDTRSLKIYCETEYDMWIDDVKTSNDEREIRKVVA
jgi:replicative DNA helicase